MTDRPSVPAFLVAVAVALVPAALAGDSPAGQADGGTFAPTADYETRDVEGWKVLVLKRFLADDPDLAARTLTHLGHQLYQVTCVIPADALGVLKGVKIWVEKDESHHPCMAYHPDPGWLKSHGMNPEKARCVEVANARHFLEWTREQPWMVLHELAHAYHHQALPGGFENPEVRRSFDKAEAARLYDEVLHYDGTLVRGYAATDPMEYFAESTEAYFGSNDFYPFVRAELRKHDPSAARLVSQVWKAQHP